MSSRIEPDIPFSIYAVPRALLRAIGDASYLHHPKIAHLKDNSYETVTLKGQ